MHLPPELQYIIMSFVPKSYLKSVCKDWNNEIKNIQLKYVSIISEWFSKRLVDENYTTIKELIRYYVVHMEPEQFIIYPEFIVDIMGLNPYLLDELPDVNVRKRSHVRDWMMNIPISYDDWY